MNFSVFKSKTIWFAILQALTSGVFVIVQDGLTEASISLAITSVVTVILRAVTDRPLSDK